MAEIAASSSIQWIPPGCLAALSGLLLLSTAHGVDITSAYPRFIEAQTFQRIREHFSGEEHKGRRYILRTDEKSRTGIYFIVLLDTPLKKISADYQLTISLITANNPEVRTFQFTLAGKPRGTREIFAGITGADSPGPDERIMAWEIRVEDGAGNLVAGKQSFLWSHP